MKWYSQLDLNKPCLGINLSKTFDNTNCTIHNKTLTTTDCFKHYRSTGSIGNEVSAPRYNMFGDARQFPLIHNTTNVFDQIMSNKNFRYFFTDSHIFVEKKIIFIF